MQALYGTPGERARGEERYTSRHLPLSAAIPGLRAQRVTSVHATADGSASPHYLVGELIFDDIEALQAGATSPEGQAAAANYTELAPPGSLLLVGVDMVDRTFRAATPAIGQSLRLPAASGRARRSGESRVPWGLTRVNGVPG